MGRPREYDRDVVVSAAKEAFWRRGYEATDLHVLEDATQLSRSSMYLAFGSKRALFDEAMVEYQATFTESVLGPVESEQATAVDAAGFFAAIASQFRGELGHRGCLIVNAIGELAGRDEKMTRQGADFYERYLRAFANALGGGGVQDDGEVGSRAQILAVAAMGVWITSRVDPVGAASACDAVAEQIKDWQEDPPREPGTRSTQPW